MKLMCFSYHELLSPYPNVGSRSRRNFRKHFFLKIRKIFLAFPGNRGTSFRELLYKVIMRGALHPWGIIYPYLLWADTVCLCFITTDIFHISQQSKQVLPYAVYPFIWHCCCDVVVGSLHNNSTDIVPRGDTGHSVTITTHYTVAQKTHFGIKSMVTMYNWLVALESVINVFCLLP